MSMEHPNTNPIQLPDPAKAGTSEIEAAPDHNQSSDPIRSLFPAASADQLLSMIAQGEDASDLNSLINNAA